MYWSCAAERARAPAEVGLEDLTDVHAARNAERVEHEVDRAAVLQVRHVLFRKDPADDALVAVTAGHLVADLELALDGDVDLHHLDDARRQLVALGEAIDLVAEVLFAGADDVLELARASAAMSSPSLDAGSRPSTCAGSRRASPRRWSAPFWRRTLPLSSTSLPVVVWPMSFVLDAAEERVAEDLRPPRRACFSRRALLVVLDVAGALVLLGALAREDARVDDDAADARRHLERAVADVAGLLAEDGAEELLFGRELGLALRRDLADEDVAGLHLGADADDARLVEVLEGLFADVRDVAGDFFLAELRVAGDALELLDVDRGEDVVLGDALGDEDRVLEVVALPRHERDEHVLAERELAHVGRRDRPRGRRPASPSRRRGRSASGCSRSTGSSAGTW